MTVAERITQYLATGGLFNPELADHAAVRDLLIDARTQCQAALEVLDWLDEPDSLNESPEVRDYRFKVYHKLSAL